LNPAQWPAFDTVMANYPNVSVIDLEFVQRQVQDIVAQVSRAIELVFWFTLLSGALVLIGTISATQHERRFDASLMRVLGANSRQLRYFDALEFGAIGTIAGVVACLSANFITMLIAKYIFDFDYQSNWLLILSGALLSVVFVLGIGLLGTRRARANAPMAILRAGLE
jgi:putative ABC transport system permease protein